MGIGMSLALASQAMAIGGSNIGNEVPSARSAGQGYVGVAGQNNDPAVVWSNPGAITNLKGTQLTVGAHWENIHGSYESDAGATTKARPVNVAVPNMSLTQSFMDGKLGAGLTVQSPYGLETNWPGNSPLRYVATNSRLATTIISPAVAYQVHPMISVGAGVDYVNLFRAQLDRHINVDAVNFALGSVTANSSDAISTLRGQSTAWGYHAGVAFQPHEKHSFGITYHSKVDLRVNGSVGLSSMSGAMAAVFGGSDYSTSAYTDLVLPQNVQFGYAFKATDRLQFQTDTAWYHWSNEKDVNVRFAESDATRLAVLNTGNPVQTSLRDAWSVATGVNYRWDDEWQWRAGFWYEPWSMPESAFHPGFLDLSRYGVSGGFGYNITPNLTLDAAYTAVFFHNRSIHNDVGTTTSGLPDTGIPALGAPSGDIDGTYKNFANLVALNLTWRFGVSK
jgi:long-chain fatty acid transport protein